MSLAIQCLRALPAVEYWKWMFYVFNCANSTLQATDRENIMTDFINGSLLIHMMGLHDLTPDKSATTHSLSSTYK